MNELEAAQRVTQVLTDQGFPPEEVHVEFGDTVVAHYPNSMGIAGTPRPDRQTLIDLMAQTGRSVGLHFDR